MDAPFRSIDAALERFAPAAQARLAPAFAAAAIPYPPAAFTLLAFKRERRLELWVAREGRERPVKVYPILAASGGPGPKLREGDLQVPEGIYAVEYLNPNSRYHLSFKLDYPNRFDREQAAREGRVDLGGDIFIHGREQSIGCIAVGDEAIEELFVLAARSDLAALRVVIAPFDFRSAPPPPAGGEAPPWCAGLYAGIAATLSRFRV